MKLKDIIANLDKSAKNMDGVDLEAMSTEVGYVSNSWLISQDRDNPRMKSYWIANHICTDTWVGYRAYFLDDVFVCCSHQGARKSDEVYTWVSVEAKIQVKEYIKSLDTVAIEEEEASLLDMEEDMGDGYPIQYTEQMLRNKVLYNGGIVEVVRDDGDGYKNCHTITVKSTDGHL